MTTRARVMNDPAASYWLKRALEVSSQRDVLDALNDAETLAQILRDEWARDWERGCAAWERSQMKREGR